MAALERDPIPEPTAETLENPHVTRDENGLLVVVVHYRPGDGIQPAVLREASDEIPVESLKLYRAFMGSLLPALAPKFKFPRLEGKHADDGLIAMAMELAKA